MEVLAHSCMFGGHAELLKYVGLLLLQVYYYLLIRFIKTLLL